MITNLERLQRILHPGEAFLLTRDQLEEAQKIVDVLIQEWAWKSTETEWPDETETVIAVVDGNAVPAFWQEMQDGDWETGYYKYRTWFYLPADDDHFIPLEFDRNDILWREFPEVPKKEKADVPTT
jgi:hypothetical protein